MAHTNVTKLGGVELTPYPQSTPSEFCQLAFDNALSSHPYHLNLDDVANVRVIDAASWSGSEKKIGKGVFEIGVVDTEEASVDGEDAFVDVEEAFIDTEEAFVDTEEAFVDTEEAFVDNEEAFSDMEEAVIDSEEACVDIEEALAT